MKQHELHENSVVLLEVMEVVFIIDAEMLNVKDMVRPLEPTKSDLLMVHTEKYLKSLEVIAYFIHIWD